MEKYCVIFIGLQASGKTTFYRERFSDLPHVNLDTLHTRNKERGLIDSGGYTRNAPFGLSERIRLLVDNLVVNY